MFPQLSEILETHYVESRRHRRHAVDELGSLCDVAVGVRNVSRGGAQVACSEAAIEAIRAHEAGEAVVFEMLTEPPLSFMAQRVYEKPEGEVQLIGLQFVQMTPEQEAAIDRFILSL